MRKISIVLLILLHALIAMLLSANLNVWADEASSLFTTNAPILKVLKNSLVIEKQAPLYFLILGLWRTVDDSVLWARLLSTIFSLFSIKIFAELAERFVPKGFVYLFTVFFSLHPFLIWASSEIRVYSLTILLSLLLLKIFVAEYLDESFSRKNSFLMILTAVIAVYTNYYLVFILLGFFLYLLLRSRGFKLRRFLREMFVVALLSIPLIFIIAEQMNWITSDGFRRDTSIVEGIKNLWNIFLTFTFPMGIFPFDEQQTIIASLRNWLARIFFLAIMLLAFRWRREIFNSEFEALVVIFLTIGSCLLISYFLLGITYVQIRHASVWFVTVIVLLAFVLSRIPSKTLLLSFVCLIPLTFAYSFYLEYLPMAKRGDWMRIAQFIEERETENQPVIVFQAYDALALMVHYRGINKILPDEEFFKWGLESNPGSEGAFRKQISFIISKIPVDAEEIWLATDETCQNPKTQAACADLENFISSNYTILLQKDFYLERLRLLRRKP